MNSKDKNIEYLENIFSAMAKDGQKDSEYVTKKDIIALLIDNGIRRKDSRVIDLITKLEDHSSTQEIYFEEFAELAANHSAILERCAKGLMIIPDFKEFSDTIKQIYDEVHGNQDGNVATYIPQLGRVDPEQFAISICTIDGQRLNIGDVDEKFCVQSTCKPINYCMALELYGERYVHNHVGREPSGRVFNEISLNRRNLPHNPMINAGAIMCSSLIHPEKSLSDRFDDVMSIWSDLSGGVRPGYNNSVYHSEKETADRNFALAHFMKEVGAFPEKTNIYETLDFYFQCCSIEVDANSMATIASNFANAGICPVTNKRVFGNESVKHCLSLMYSCGMYDFSGEFAFTVGLPAKSGVSGALMIVIPNLMGICVWSPRLDEMGNSVRGVMFAQELIKHFNFHNYDSLIDYSDKIDPRRKKIETHANNIFNMIYSASQGDIAEIKRLISYGADVNATDYDGRTPLHLAAAEGKTETVRFLLERGADKNLRDRWGKSPIGDAKKSSHDDVIALLEE